MTNGYGTKEPNNQKKPSVKKPEKATKMPRRKQCHVKALDNLMAIGKK
jgi:hypothetical protein